MDPYELAFDIALNTDRNLFVTGKAGTGKTTFLHRLKEASRKQMAVVAPTGVAAINAGGTTIHSFFQLPFSPFIPTPEGRKNLVAKSRMRSSRRRVLQELELLVIDEISMVRADLLDAMDATLRHFRYKNNEPFGGVQVVFIGDMFQLAPVAKEEEWSLLSHYYQSPYFFHSQVVTQSPPFNIEFQKIYRQTNSSFIRVLNEIRDNKLTAESRKLLEERYDPRFIPPEEENYIILTTHNHKADRINAEELGKLEGEAYTFNAGIDGDYPERNYPTEPVLELKVGAKVMFLRNDTETPRRFYNGKIGVVDTIDDDRIAVRCGGDELIEVERTAWENISYTVDAETKQVEENVLGKFSQYPLRLAWAITIHKSQGLTFDKAVIDAGMAFAPGQVYVALSRCRSLEGMVLLSRIQHGSISTDGHIVEQEKSRPPIAAIEQQLADARGAYRAKLLESVFDFSGLAWQCKRLISDIDEVVTSFNEETLPHLNDLQGQLQEAGKIAIKFQAQLRGIFQQEPVDENYLRERVHAAHGFFIEKMDRLIHHLKQSPAKTDSRAHAVQYNEAVQDIFSDLAMKKQLLDALKSDTSVDAYFKARNDFILPPFHVNAYTKTSATRSDLSHPALYRLLVEERDQICEPRDLPIYIVAGSKTLYEMAEYLPQDEKELLQISGFGPVKVEKYGQAFLSIIRSYCEKHGLQSRLDEKEASKRELKEQKRRKQEKQKKQKGDSQRISLAMHREGKSIDEIAEERGLALSTISTHLAKYVEKGELDAVDFISRDRIRLAEEKLQARSPDESMYHTLQFDFSQIEIMMVIAYTKNRSL